MIRATKLVLVAALAASLPVAALADDDCRHRDRHPVAWAPPAYPPPQAPQRWGEGRWREARWRERELAALRAEFHALDEERARFYARPGVRRGQARRFERYFAERRAELEQRWSALQLVAWR